MNWLMRLAALCAALSIGACTASDPFAPLPARSVSKVVGTPGETDVLCDVGRWADGGRCDYVVPDISVFANFLHAGRMYRLDDGVDRGQSPYVYEIGSAPVTTRLWVHDIWLAWQNVCTGVTSGVCAVRMNYRDQGGNDIMYLDVIANVFDPDPPLVNAYFHTTSGASGPRVHVQTYAVAYDTGTGSYGVTQASLRMGRHLSLAAGVGGGLIYHDGPDYANPNPVSFATDFPAWHPIE
ncbi:hypothetical protein KBD34_04160 [Patescibacteria group bacterium]|nr:hypothetical protein [Patescibacteria group bacterium]